jgi:hypothetical protein
MAEQNAVEWLEDQLFNFDFYKKNNKEKLEFLEIVEKLKLKTNKEIKLYR